MSSQSWIPFGRRRSAFRIPTRGRADASLCGLCRLSSSEDSSSLGPRMVHKRKRPTEAGLLASDRGRRFTFRIVPQTIHSLRKGLSGERRRSEPDLSEIPARAQDHPLERSRRPFFRGLREQQGALASERSHLQGDQPPGGGARVGRLDLDRGHRP